MPQAHGMSQSDSMSRHHYSNYIAVIGIIFMQRVVKKSASHDCRGRTATSSRLGKNIVSLNFAKQLTNTFVTMKSTNIR